MELNPEIGAGDSNAHVHDYPSNSPLPANARIITIHPHIESDQGDDEEGKKRRELLSRRPSYRKILNDLSSDPTVAKTEDDSTDDLENSETNDLQTHTISVAPSLQTVVLPQSIQLASHTDLQGLQTLTMTNANTSTPSQSGATIVQYAQSADGQFFIPIAGSGVQAYQISTPTSLPQGVVMTAGGVSIGSPQAIGEDASRKRELRLLKNRWVNREAARECRRKKKDYVKCLENRVAVLENQNKQLIEELKSLKELYCQKEAGVVQDGVTILQTTLQ